MAGAVGFAALTVYLRTPQHKLTGKSTGCISGECALTGWDAVPAAFSRGGSVEHFGDVQFCGTRYYLHKFVDVMPPFFGFS